MAKRKPAARPARVDVKKYLDTAGGTLQRLQTVGQGMVNLRPLNGQPAQPNYQANPNETPVPHIITFTGYTGQLGKVYRNADEAWRHSRDNARYMRNDLAVMECLEARQRSIALLPWHLETDRPKDLLEQSMVSTLTTAIKQIPRFTEFRRVLQEAVWYGREGIQVNYGAKLYYDQQIIIPQKSSYNEAWTPVNGDKLAFRYDDGRVGIRIGFTMPPESVTTDKDSQELNSRIKFLEGDKYLWDGSRIRKIEITNEYGRVYFLDDDETDRILVHKHMIEDGDFETPLSAGRIHGVGVRDRIYWTWFQKQNTIGLLMEYLERSALGFEIWTYPMGNVLAQAAIEKAAFERVGAGKNIVFMPVIPGQADLYRMEHIETGLQGIEMVDTIVHRYFEWQIKRYILGQVLSSEPESGGLSASSLSDFQKGSLFDILTYDARSAEETLSNWVNQGLKKRNRHLLPIGADNIPVRMVLDTESEEMEKRLEACQRVYEMGVPLRKDDFYPMIGAEKPAPADEVIQKQPDPPPGMGGPPGMGPNGQPPPGGGPGGQPGQPGQPPGGQGQENPHEIGPQAPKASPPGLGTSKYKEFQESDVIRDQQGQFATQAGGGGEVKSLPAPARPGGTKDWKKLKPLHTEQEWHAIADRLVKNTDEDSFKKQVDFMAKDYETQGFKPGMARAMAAIDTHAQDLTGAESLRRKGSAPYGGASSGHAVDSILEDEAFEHAWEVGQGGDPGEFEPTQEERDEKGNSLPRKKREKKPVKTDSPEFKKWFGKSKVVDDSGKPLVMYHGTTEDFSEFTPQETLFKGDIGYHFGTKDQADKFTREYNKEEISKPGSSIKPVYLAIDNPLRIEDTDWTAQPLMLAHQFMEADVITKDEYEEVNQDTTPKNMPWRETQEHRPGHRQRLIKVLAKHGYDGLVYNNGFEGEGDSYVAFHPSQIKSAIGNKGTYDKDDPRINYAARETYADFEERKHPRGQPDNKGQFAKTPGAGGSSAEDSGKGEPKGEEPAKKGGGERAEKLAKEYKELGTKAPAFKQWFGDWEDDPASASKVVDAEGKPKEQYEIKKVFHGTTANFDAFDPEHKGKHGSVVGDGFYFAENEDIAKTYAQEGGQILESYLNIRNPFDFDARIGKEEIREIIKKSVKPSSNVDEQDVDYEVFDALRRWGPATDDTFAGWQVHSAVLSVVGSKRVNAVMTAAGYDGITHLSRDEGGTPRTRESQENFGRVWIAFKPNQIKSVDNQGTFDPDDERMKYAGWEEAKHPRGQPENAGQFGPGGGGNQPSEQPSEKPPAKAPEQPKTPEKAPVSTKPAEAPNAEALAQSHGLVGISPGLKESLDKIDHHYPPANPGAIDTLERFSTDGGKTLTRERGALHHAMIARHLRAAPQFGPEEKGVFTLMGGGPASGKSSLLASKSIEPPEGVTSNADDFKELLPEYGAFLEHKDTRGAAYAHEESSKLAKDLLSEAFATRRHATLDGTGDGSIKGLKQKCEAARAAGYAVKGEYATCSVDNALLRAGIRAKKKGRTVPTEVIKDTHKGVSKILPDAVKQGLFDSVNLWDTEIQGQPRLVMSAVGSQMKVHDEGLWQSFLDKANG